MHHRASIAAAVGLSAFALGLIPACGVDFDEFISDPLANLDDLQMADDGDEEDLRVMLGSRTCTPMLQDVRLSEGAFGPIVIEPRSIQTPAPALGSNRPFELDQDRERIPYGEHRLLYPDDYKLGEYAEFRGTLDFVPTYEGSTQVLVLDKAYLIEGEIVKTLFLRHTRFDVDGGLKLWGKLTHFWRVWGTDEIGVVLTGISNLSNHEPRFDGQYFMDEGGKRLVSLRWPAQMVPHHDPFALAVIEPEQTVALGWMGGTLPMGASPFVGFYRRLPYTPPTSRDCASISIAPDGTPVNAAGDALELVGGTRANFERRWWLDRDNSTIYELDRFFGRAPRLSSIIRLPW
jgi:hypothetical protein